MTPKEKLRIFGDFPDHKTTAPILFQITDDAAIKEIIVRTGRANALNPRPELGPGGMRLATYFGDEKYFYLIRHYYGYEKAEDNGYVAYLILRATCSTDDALKMLRKLANEGGDGPALVDRIEAIPAN
jgi:hypothetical protein